MGVNLKLFKRTLISELFLSHLILTAALIYLPLVLFIHAQTMGGFLVGSGFVLFFSGLLLLWLLRFKKLRLAGGIIAGVALLGCICCFLIAYCISPDGKIPDGNFSQNFSGEAHFSRGSLPNIVPEIDQLNLGTYLFSYTDPFMDHKQGGRLRRLVLEIYHEMREEPGFADAGSVLGMCYEDLFTGKRESLHFYEYVPRHLKKEKYPVIIFLHGSLGNFKGYTWVLKSLSDSEGYAIIAPTYGAGNWYLDKESAILNATYEYCSREPFFDKNSIYLACLSNGGTGLTREVMKNGKRYKGFILISPVAESAVISTEKFLKNSKDKPFLFIHGEKDRRIPVEAIRSCERLLKEKGRAVSSNYYPEEDHFLFFSQRSSVIQNIADWLKKNETLKP